MLQNNLFFWYESNRRSFPWRENITPYRIMIAEFMLHRTKADQVVAVYNKFLDKYPDIKSLANANLNDIKEVTDHLGLHWRSEHFIKAAKYIIENYNGTFPVTREELLKIPGIGDYVSGAILTVCYNKPEYVIDSNIARFINRYYDLRLTGEIRRKKNIIEKARELFNFFDTSKLLFAILDFTALICKPLKPLCEECCLNTKCLYYRNNP